MRVAYTGGGTGGHVYPALGIDEALRALPGGRGAVRVFIGSRDGLESRLVGNAIPMRFVPAAPLARRRTISSLRTLAVNAAGVARAFGELVRFRPDVVVATGGYVCFPVAVAARLQRALVRRRPALALLEINATPGLTNALLRPLVDEVWIGYEASRAAFGAKAVFTGAPTRASVHALPSREEARAGFGFSSHATVILAFGGSQGARSINTAVAALANDPSFPDRWQILHVCGERDREAIERAYASTPLGRVRLVTYLDDPAPAYAAADIAIGRSGASTLAELAVAGLPSILVPYPHAGAHQEANARVFADAGAAVVLDDASLDAPTLRTALDGALAPQRLALMRAASTALGARDAARAIAQRVIALGRTRGKRSAASNETARHEG